MTTGKIWNSKGFKKNVMAILQRSKGSVATIILATVLFFPTTAAPFFSNGSPVNLRLNANPDQLTNSEWRICDINGDGKFDFSL